MRRYEDGCTFSSAKKTIGVSAHSGFSRCAPKEMNDPSCLPLACHLFGLEEGPLPTIGPHAAHPKR